MNKVPKRVVIIGTSGCGKTTLARFLSEKWDLPMCDLDDLYWLPGWKERDRAEELADVERVVAGEKWVIAGNYSRHRELIWYRADLIIWLDLSLVRCAWRGLSRSIRNIWYRRPMCNGNYDGLDRLLRLDNRSILYWVLTTHKKKRTRYLKLLETEKDPKLPKHFRFTSPREVASFISKTSCFHQEARARHQFFFGSLCIVLVSFFALSQAWRFFVQQLSAR